MLTQNRQNLPLLTVKITLIFEEYGTNQDYEEKEIIINIEGTMRLLSEDEYNEHTSKLKYVNLVDEEDDDWDDYWDEDDDNDGEE